MRTFIRVFILSSVAIAIVVGLIAMIDVGLDNKRDWFNGGSGSSENEAEWLNDEQRAERYSALLDTFGIPGTLEEAEDLGTHTCALLDSMDGDIQATMRVFTDSDTANNEQAAAVVQGAVTYYCDQYQEDIDTFIGTWKQDMQA